MSLIISAEIPDNWTEEQKAAMIERVKNKFKMAGVYLSVAEPKKKPHRNEGSNIVYRGHGDMIVATRKVENYKGEMVDGHYYEVGTQEECLQIIGFQNGPVPQVGNNGVTNEALLAIVIDRTEVLNNLFPCEENVNALDHMKSALREFELRTRRRMARGVEGKEIR